MNMAEQWMLVCHLFVQKVPQNWTEESQDGIQRLGVEKEWKSLLPFRERLKELNLFQLIKNKIEKQCGYRV